PSGRRPAAGGGSSSRPPARCSARARATRGTTHLTHSAPGIGEARGVPRGGGRPAPRMPRPLQGARMLLTEHRMLERYRRRYGDVFAVDVWRFEPLVVVSDPAEVRRIFTGDPAQLHAGEGNGVLEPLV